VPRQSRKEASAFYGSGSWFEAEAAGPQITRDKVVRKALELLNEDGFDGLTMRRLAEKLGIKAASLYNHVKAKDELLALMANAICAEVLDLDPSRPWREQAETMALQVRRVLMAYRDGARVLAATPPVGPQRLRLIEQLLHALVGAGLSRARVVDAAFLLNSYVVGFVLDETLGYPKDTALAKRMREEARRWFKSLPRRRYPTVVALADELVDAPADRRFKRGLRALLDGLQRESPKKGKRA
jgi:TetR/AcrR family tetracycline transcriptional repressor